MYILRCSVIVKFIATYVYIMPINRIVNGKWCSESTDKSTENELIYCLLCRWRTNGIWAMVKRQIWEYNVCRVYSVWWIYQEEITGWVCVACILVHPDFHRQLPVIVPQIYNNLFINVILHNYMKLQRIL